jgi:regulator of replication initiation timing
LRERVDALTKENERLKREALAAIAKRDRTDSPSRLQFLSQSPQSSPRADPASSPSSLRISASPSQSPGQHFRSRAFSMHAAAHPPSTIASPNSPRGFESMDATEIKKLKQNVAELTAELAACTHQLQQFKQDNSGLTANLSDATATSARLSTEMDQLRLKLGKSLIDYEQLVSRHADVAARLERRTEEYLLLQKESTSQIIELQRLVAEREDQCLVHSKELEFLKLALKESLDDTKNLVLRNNALQAQLDDLTEQNNALQAQLEDAKSSISHLTSESKQLSINLNATTSANERTLADLRALNERTCADLRAQQVSIYENSASLYGKPYSLYLSLVVSMVSMVSLTVSMNL